MAWSPSGGHIAYTSNDRELLVRDVAAGTDTTLLDVARPERLEVIEFSPDGQRILFHRSDSGGARSLWSIGADGSNLVINRGTIHVEAHDVPIEEACANSTECETLVNALGVKTGASGVGR